MTTNSQILDAVGKTNEMAIGLAAPLSMGLVYTMGADSISLVMGNAQSTQHNAQSVSTSTSAITNAMIIKMGLAAK